jgi:SRSO17 transposase
MLAARRLWDVTFSAPTDDEVPDLNAFLDRVGPRFGRAEPRRRARQYVRAVASGLARVNAWTLAEFAGDRDPDGMQRLLNAARWDVDGVRDDLRDWVVPRLASAPGVLVLDEIAFVKSGTHSAGVQRQYLKRTGRVENVQLGAFLAYASPVGQALVDRELFLPESWLRDRDRSRRAGVPDDAGFATVAELGRRMVERALAARVPATWVTGTEVFGESEDLRAWLEQRGIAYLMAVDHPGAVSGRCARSGDGGWTTMAQDGYRHSVDDRVWERLLLVREHPARPAEPELYRCHAPAETAIETLARIGYRLRAGLRLVQRSRTELGLDQYQVRRYDAWYRHVTLCMLAGAYLAATRRPG